MERRVNFGYVNIVVLQRDSYFERKGFLNGAFSEFFIHQAIISETQFLRVEIIKL